MKDELKQLAEKYAPTFVTSAYSLGVEDVEPLLESFGREVQRQTVEAAEWAMDSELTQDELSGEAMVFPNGLVRRLKARIRRALLSPAQEVRNG